MKAKTLFQSTIKEVTIVITGGMKKKQIQVKKKCNRLEIIATLIQAISGSSLKLTVKTVSNQNGVARDGQNAPHSQTIL